MMAGIMAGAFVIFAVTALVLDVVSMQHRVVHEPMGCRPGPRFPPRAHFSEKGWRLRRLMFLCSMMAAACLFAWGALETP
jgi:hypothetical protein